MPIPQELPENHRALLFSKEKNLMAFPVTVMEIKGGDDAVKGGVPQHGEFSFQGAYVYDIDLQHGFKLKGRITHLPPKTISSPGETGTAARETWSASYISATHSTPCQKAWSKPAG